MRVLRDGFIGLAMICFLIAPSVALSSEWVFYGEAPDNSYKSYYDKQAIIVTPKKTLTVSVKHVYSDTGRSQEILQRTRQNLPTAGFENLSHRIDQYELNCKTREFDFLSTAAYGRNGRTLESSYNAISEDARKWTPIMPQSIGEALFKRVCAQPKK